MKLVFLGVGIVGATALTFSTFAQAPSPMPVKVLGCLQGDGSEQKPWFISGVALPAPVPSAAPGGGGRGGGRGGGGGGAAAGAPAGAAPGAAPGAAAGGGQAGGRGGGRGGGAAAPAVPAAPVPLVDLLLTGGINMSAWRGMKIEVEGTLAPKPATGLQEIRITSARSVQGVCAPK